MSATMKFTTFCASFLDPDPAGFEFHNPSRSDSGRTWTSGNRYIPT